MSRLQADCLLALAGLIWGFGFVAQKEALAHMGPFTFVACRFLIAVLAVMPFALWEAAAQRRVKMPVLANDRRQGHYAIWLYLSFAAAVLLQQWGLVTTRITNAAFLTGLYVVMVPAVGWLLYRQRIAWIVWPAGLLSVAGVWLLGGGLTDTGFSSGEIAILLCALCYAFQVIWLGRIGQATRRPYMLAAGQFLTTGLIALLLALAVETPSVADMLAGWPSLLFSGVVASGLCYTVQAIAQQHTPPADAAIIMSSEAVFGGVSGVLFFHDPLNGMLIGGCGAILLAILLVEAGPLLSWSRRWRPRKPSR